MKADGAGLPDALELRLWLRAAGSAYVWPRLWSLEAQSIDSELAAGRLRRWLGLEREHGQSRCGIGTAVTAAGTTIVVAVAVSALADLSAKLPVRVRSGQWLTVDADLLVPASDARLMVMGPGVAAHAVPTEISDGHARAGFRADRPGEWTAQLVVAVQDGARPALEAEIYADCPPPTSTRCEDDSWPSHGTRHPTAADQVRAWINAARQAWGLELLLLDPRLNAIAERHAWAMLKSGRLGHEAGDGDPGTRVRAAVPESRFEGENVARAATLVGAQRAMWASPSHRANILQGRFDLLGVGVAADDQGLLWVCEVFSDASGP
ncbi:MAG: CAP domain-containing protein [Polyangiaceae bacterium]|nr:CAP domain-containing protein [Polyangiaceae bacterium]